MMMLLGLGDNIFFGSNMQELLRSNKTEGGVVLPAMFRTLNGDWNLMPIWRFHRRKTVSSKIKLCGTSSYFYDNSVICKVSNQVLVVNMKSLMLIKCTRKKV
jgi:glucose-1-phosphate thymidylyltransferase